MCFPEADVLGVYHLIAAEGECPPRRERTDRGLSAVDRGPPAEWDRPGVHVHAPKKRGGAFTGGLPERAIVRAAMHTPVTSLYVNAAKRPL